MHHFVLLDQRRVTAVSRHTSGDSPEGESGYTMIEQELSYTEDSSMV